MFNLTTIIHNNKSFYMKKKILDKYIIKNFLSKFLLIMLSFVTVFTAVDIIDNIDRFIEYNIDNNEIFLYYLYTLPWYLSLALPMTLLISTVFCFSLLQKNQEITAMKASGLSIFRISSPIIICGVIFCFISFFFENLVVVNSMQKRSSIEKKIKPNYQYNNNKKNNIYYHLDNSFLTIKKYNYKNDSAHNISIQSYEGSDLKNRFDAKYMLWNEQKKIWQFNDVNIRKWQKGIYKYHTISDTAFAIKDINPEIIKNDIIDPEEMNYWELKNFIIKLKDKGLDYNRWEVNKHFKTGFACSSIIMIIFGIVLSIQKPRSNFATGIGLSMAIIFLYYLFIKTGQTIGYNNILPPFFAIWLVNFIFLLIGTYLFINSRT